MHVSYATLEQAVIKISEYDPSIDELASRAKRLVQKCVYALVLHQELLCQQVCSYLMEFGDHYTSHYYHNLFWTMYNSF